MKIQYICIILALCSAVYGKPKTAVKKNSNAILSSAPLVETDTVFLSKEENRRQYVGVIEQVQSVDAVPSVSGEMLRMGFVDGDFVKKGQVLYEIDPTRYIAAVKGAEAKIAQIKAQLAYAENNFKRYDTMLKKHATSQEHYETALRERDTLKAELLEAEAKLIHAKDELKYTKIVAAIDGKAGKNNFDPGTYLTPLTGVLVTIMQVDPIRMRFSVGQRDFYRFFGNAKNPEQVTVKIKLANDTIYPYSGKIAYIDNMYQKGTDSIHIYADFENPDVQLLPGGVVTVMLEKKSLKQYPAIHSSALIRTSKGACVYVIGKDNVPELRYVDPGNSINNVQIIYSGLKAGETVVTEGMHKIMSGIKVRTVKRSKEKK